MALERRVAIIGGGIGGLSAAYYLHGRTSPDGAYVYVCEVYEKSGRLGGNGLSAYFEQPYAKPFADLGVNDFNLNTYTRMKAVLEDLERSGFPVPSAPLTDTDCFFTLPGQFGPPLVFTSQDVEQGTTPLTRAIAADEKKFAVLAGQVMTDPKYATMSVGTFLDTEGFSREFCVYYILPRINGMYFMGPVMPEDMPIRGVMNYYLLQEGVGGTPDRRYFERGCSDWFRQLGAALRARGVKVHLSAAATVTASPAGLPRVRLGSGEVQEFHAVVLAVPADQVEGVVREGLPPEVPPLLCEFRYVAAEAVAHTYAGVMPADRKNWRTYNIRIFPPGSGPQPYTISYVETMHQGAPNADPPCWFVTETPPVPIPPENVLKMIDLETGGRTRAVASFRHNTVTVGTMYAQSELCALQGRNRLWYTGGWTNGAGLHEQILVNSSDVAEKITGLRPMDAPCPTHSARDPHHVPEYLRNVLEGMAAAQG